MGAIGKGNTVSIRRCRSRMLGWGVLAPVVVLSSLLLPGMALAGGLTLYEVGTDDVGLASAGYGARAQDASTLLTNPAGMTRLDGTRLLLGGQVLYGDVRMTLDENSSSTLGTGDGGNAIGFFPGAGAYITFSPSNTVRLGIGRPVTSGSRKSTTAIGPAGTTYRRRPCLACRSCLRSHSS